MFKQITEGKAKIYVPKQGKISKKLPVFYNPVMKFNRDLSVEIMKIIKPDRIGLPLAGTGVRGFRLALELDSYELISINDQSKDAYELMKRNAKLNNVDIEISNMDANQFMLNSSGFDYIDIDPFGSPNPFLDTAVNRLSRKGVLAVTATDTAPLCGTYPKVCRRKYWAEPKRDEQMYETGIRILIRKVQLIGAQYDKALIPIYSYFRDHYFRIFFEVAKGKTHVDLIIKKHGMHGDAGPMWLGRLWDEKIAAKAANQIDDRFVELIKNESVIDSVGYFDTHKFAKLKKLKSPPRINVLIDKITRNGKSAAQTHFRKTAIRTDA